MHRRLGLTGVFLYFVMIPLGFAATIEMGRRGFDLSGDLKVLPHASPGFVDPIAGLLFPLTDMAMFALLAGAALCFVRQCEIHKRLMLFANIMLMPAPLAHLIGHNPWSAALPPAVIMVPIGVLLAAAILRDFFVARRVHPLTVHPVHSPQGHGHLQIRRLALLVPAQVLKERLALTGFRDGKQLVHRWRDDPVAALPEVLRMAVGQVGIVPFDPERLKRPHILRGASSRCRAAREDR